MKGIKPILGATLLTCAMSCSTLENALAYFDSFEFLYVLPSKSVLENRMDQMRYLRTLPIPSPSIDDMASIQEQALSLLKYSHLVSVALLPEYCVPANDTPLEQLVSCGSCFDRATVTYGYFLQHSSSEQQKYVRYSSGLAQFNEQDGAVNHAWIEFYKDSWKPFETTVFKGQSSKPLIPQASSFVSEEEVFSSKMYVPLLHWQRINDEIFLTKRTEFQHLIKEAEKNTIRYIEKQGTSSPAKSKEGLFLPQYIAQKMEK